jgi:hypothetical protein
MLARRPGYAFPMAEEWRVSLILDGRGGTSHCRDLLRSRFGDDVAVSVEKARIFLYAGSEKAAGEAEYVAREVMAQQGLNAEFRVERWDPSDEEWRAPGEPTEPDDKPEPGRLRSTATALLKGAAQAAMRGDF